jgi:hypothetical protein
MFSRTPTSPANTVYELAHVARQYLYLTKKDACKDKTREGGKRAKKKIGCQVKEGKLAPRER